MSRLPLLPPGGVGGALFGFRSSVSPPSSSISSSDIDTEAKSPPNVSVGEGVDEREGEGEDEGGPDC